MVEQLGLAMIPPCPYRIPFMASAFTSGMIRGTPSVILKAELLSTTCASKQLSLHVLCMSTATQLSLHVSCIGPA